MRLFLATSNLGKIGELQAMLDGSGLPVEAHTPLSVGGMPPVVEDQDSFSGNALKKARALSALLSSDDYALADDSGLCVDALEGAPGVFSARFAGAGASDEANNDKLLRSLASVEVSRRTAFFACRLALVSPRGEERLFVGEWSGRIARSPRGRNGFGYDPIFIPDGETRTSAELSPEEKARASHRGQAMTQLVDWLRGRSEDGLSSPPA